MAQTPRMTALQNLANSLPVADNRMAQQQQAARDIQLQNTVRQLPPKAATQQTAQQAGAVAAQNAGAQAIDRAQQQIQSNQQIGQTGLAEQGRQNQAELGAAQLGANEQQFNNAQQLAQISEQAKQEMFDSRLVFAKDEAGKEFLNQRQLDDYAASKAKSADEFANYSQQQEQLYQRKSQMLEQSYKLLSQKLQSEAAIARQLEAQANDKTLSEAERAQARDLFNQKARQNEELTQRMSALEASIAEEQADAANRKARQAAIGGTIGAVGGGVVGAIYGGPAGAAAGASAGSALGSGIASAFGG